MGSPDDTRSANSPDRAAYIDLFSPGSELPERLLTDLEGPVSRGRYLVPAPGEARMSWGWVVELYPYNGEGTANEIEFADCALSKGVVVDEAQSLERNVLLTVLSRIGQNSRVVLTHDVAQRDNLRVGRHDGVASVIETLKGHPLFAHITLTRSERSAIAALVTEMLEGNEVA